LKLAYPATPTHALQGYTAIIPIGELNLERFDL